VFRHRNEYPVEGELPSFDGATAWVNADPPTAGALDGRVVLVSFGTYTCINWIRSLPWVRAWADKYRELGLAVVGVQTPEFDFEGDVDWVRRALTEMDVRYQVAVDNDYAVWRAFDNHYWPALYFVDAEGRIRHHHFGEGEYIASEVVLQMLLREAGRDVDEGLVDLVPAGVEAAADWANLRSPETYLGSGRAVGFASPGALRRNEWGLLGGWRVEQESARLDEAGGAIQFRFHARDVHLVMGPPAASPPVRFAVRLDGESPGQAHGVDVDEGGGGTADYQRMYQLIRQPGPIDDQVVEIEFLDAGVEAFVFTFG
jgi:hypothetical protein